jgi:hypothetical protein
MNNARPVQWFTLAILVPLATRIFHDETTQNSEDFVLFPFTADAKTGPNTTNVTRPPKEQKKVNRVKASTKAITTSLPSFFISFVTAIKQERQSTIAITIQP